MATVTIEFKVIGLDELEKAKELLRQMVQPLQQYQTSAVGVAEATQTMSTTMARGVDFTSLWRQNLENVAMALGASEEKAARAGEILEKLTTTTVSPRVETRYLNELAEITGKSARTMQMEVAMLRDAFEELSRVDVTGNLPTQFTRIGAIIPHLSSLAETLGREYGLVDDQLQQFTTSLTNLARLKLPEAEFRRAAETLAWAFMIPQEAIEETIQEMRQHAATYIDEVSKMQRASRGAAEGMEPIVEILRKQTRENMIFQATIGPIVNTMRQMTSQFYWWGVGIMFVTMSFARLQTRMLQHQQRAFSLARAYMSVMEAQEEFNRAIIESGAASEEARRAYGRLEEAKYAYNMAIEATRAALVQENLAWAQLIFGAFPVVINAFRLGFDMGLLLFKGQLFAAVGSTVLSTTENTQLIPALWNVTVTAFGTSQAMRLFGNEALGAAIKTVLAKALMMGLVTAGISVAIAIGLISWATAEADRQTKELMADTEKLADQFLGGAYSASQFEHALYGGSLVDALEKARIETLKLSEVLSKIRFPEAGIYQYDIVGRVQPVEVPEVEDQYQNIIQKLVPVEIERPRDLTQTIYQRIEAVRFPEVPETVYQNIIQRLYSVRIEEPRDLTQYIYQKIVEARVEELPPIYQNVYRRLVGEIPTIESQTMIIRRIVTGEIPRVTDQVLNIKRVVSGDIPQIRDQILNVRRVIIGDIPEVREQQLMVRRVIVGEIPVPEDQVLNVHRIVLGEIPGVEEQVQYVRRRLIEEVPALNEIVQRVRRVVAVDVPNVLEGYQYINRVLTEDVSPVRDQVQRISRTLVADIPEVEDAVQNVSRVLVSDIPSINETVQPVRRILVEDVPRIEEVVQPVNRVLVNEIPEVPPTVVPISGGEFNNVYINVSFPNLIIREETDIGLIEDTVFRAIHTGLRGEVIVR